MNIESISVFTELDRLSDTDSIEFTMPQFGSEVIVDTSENEVASI